MKKRNVEKQRIYANNYKKRNPLYVRMSSLRSTAKQRGISFDMLLCDFVEWVRSQPDCCYYCHSKFVGNGDKQIDRKDPNLGYSVGNMVFACFRCNRYKSDIFKDCEWAEILEKYSIKERYS